jgi:hypothetical protein
MNSIHSSRGIPAGAFAYDNISILQATVAARDTTISNRRARLDRYFTTVTDLQAENRDLSGQGVRWQRWGRGTRLPSRLRNWRRLPRRRGAFFEELEEDGWMAMEDGTFHRNVCSTGDRWDVFDPRRLVHAARWTVDT